MTENPPRVVITGMGLIHGLGIGLEPLMAGVGDDTEPDAAAIECSDFEPEEYRESGKTYLDRCSDLTLGACYLAVRDAGLHWQDAEHPRWGVSLGTAYGCLASMLNMTGRVQQKGLRFGSPVIFTHSFANSPGALAAIEYDLQGPCMTHCLGDLSGAAALEYALRTLRLGRVDLLLGGGVEALSQPLLAARDRWSPGAIPAEGAAILVAETAAHAAGRGLTPLAELAGAAVLSQAGDGAALEAALADAGVDSAEVVQAPAACGHAFGASVALDAAACVGVVAAGGGPVAAVSRDGRAALVFRTWEER
jgi:3-oxoacyl-(acyl-carrier-protein) synthase